MTRIFATRWASLAQMEARAEEWRALAERAVEPNVYAQADYVLPALHHLGGKGVRFLVVEADGVLAGVLPLRGTLLRWGVPLRAAEHYLPYAPHGVPLVAREGAADICAAMMDALAVLTPRPQALLLPYVPQDGPFAAAWRAAAARSGRQCVALDPFERAVMVPDAGEARQTYLATRLSKHRKRRLDQQRRKLEQEHGPLGMDVASGPAEVATALERFFTLEAAGWKGRRGTAAGQETALAAFFRASVPALAERGQARILSFDLDGEPLASALLLIAQDRAWFYKTAYDERFARYSPGILLDATVTEYLLADPSIAIGDSLAIAGKPGGDPIWREGLAMVHLLVSPASGDAPGFALALRLETLRRRARDGAKALVQSLRALLRRKG